MYYRIKLGTESPPRSFCYKDVIAVGKGRKPETQNTTTNHFSAYMHINDFYNEAQMQTNNQKAHQYMILQHKKDNTFTPVTIKSTRRNEY